LETIQQPPFKLSCPKYFIAKLVDSKIRLFVLLLVLYLITPDFILVCDIIY